MKGVELFRSLFALLGLVVALNLGLSEIRDKLGGWQEMYTAPTDGSVIEIRQVAPFGLGWVGEFRYQRWREMRCTWSWYRVDNPDSSIIDSRIEHYRWRPL